MQFNKYLALGIPAFASPVIVNAAKVDDCKQRIEQFNKKFCTKMDVAAREKTNDKYSAKSTRPLF